MKRIFVVVVLITLVSVNLFSDTQGEEMEYSRTDSGLEYVFTKTGDGEKALAGSRVSVHYVGKLEDGTQFDSSIDRNTPFEFELGAGQVIKGWDEGIALMKVGDKVTFRIPSELGYGKRGAGGVIPPDAILIFDVELLEVMPPVVVEVYDIEGKVHSKTESGLEFILVEEGSGTKAAAGNTVFVHYSGYLEDGTMFDSSVKRDQQFTFVLGMGRVIKGWDEGIALMKEGDKARLIIPSDLGYGERGAGGVIPPNAKLIFDVELIEVIK